MYINNQELYKIIKEEMKKQNLSQSDIAKTLNVNRADINIALKNLENGKSITTRKLFLILGAMNKAFIISDEW